MKVSSVQLPVDACTMCTVCTELKLAAFSPAASCAFLRHVLTPARCLQAVINAEINVNKQKGDPRKRLFKRRTLTYQSQTGAHAYC